MQSCAINVGLGSKSNIGSLLCKSAVSVSTRNDQSQSQSRLLRLSGLSLSLESRPDKDLVSVSVSIPKTLVSSAAGSQLVC